MFYFCLWIGEKYLKTKANLQNYMDILDVVVTPVVEI